MKKFEIAKPTLEEIDGCWSSNKLNSVFTKRQFLEKVSYSVDWYSVKKGDDTVCVWPICLNEKNKVYLPDFTYYVGPIWSEKYFNSPNHRKLSIQTNVYEEFIKKFESKYSYIQASLPIYIYDVRVFDWWNYHDQSKERIKLSPRYTSIITDLQKRDFKLDYRQTRRNILRNLENKKNYIFEECHNKDRIINLYNQVMSRSNIKVDKITKETVHLILDYALSNNGSILQIRDTICNKISYASICLSENHTANLIISIVANDYRKQDLAVLGIHKTINFWKEKGIDNFDFNGSNSPQRGDDKHSYGGETKLFFDLNYRTVLC